MIATPPSTRYVHSRGVAIDGDCYVGMSQVPHGVLRTPV